MRYLLLLIFAWGLHGQTFGSGKIAHLTPSGSTFTLTGVTASAGSTIWVFFGTNDGAGCAAGTFTVSDGGGNTYTQIGTNNSRTYTCAAHWYAKNVTGFSGNIVVDPSVGYSAANIGYVEIQSADPAAPVNGTGTADGSPSATGALTAAGNELIVHGVINYYTGGTYTANNSFTIPANGTSSGAGGAAAIQYRIVAAGTYTPSFGITGSVYTGNLSASFRAGAPASTVRRRVVIQ